MIPTYFPNTPDPFAAQPLSIGVGQTTGDIEIRMITAHTFQVSGVVIDEAGRPLVNVMVRLVDETSRTPMSMRCAESRTDASGRFIIGNVTSGRYALLAAAPVVISREARSVSGGSLTVGLSGGIIGRSVGNGVMTETRNGMTVQYRDDTATRMPITVGYANVSGLEVIVRPPLQ